MSPLDRKLFRDLWRIKLQAVAIALVISVGVMLLIMMDGLFNSLEQTRAAYYDRYRLADVFAPVKRAPDSVLDQIAEIDGVSAVEGRVIGGALIDMDEEDVPIRAQAVSLPDFGTPRLNDVYLASGRMIDPQRRDEILLLQGFAVAHELAPGDTLTATLNGARRMFVIAGLAQSPEFLYATAPGEIVPDDSRFAVIWMREEALAAAYDVHGAFNEALIALERGAEVKSVTDKLDRLLARYGGIGAYGLEDQYSNRFVSEEIRSLRLTSASVPPIFISVAAFLLYIVVSRMIEAERTQIGLLKAFGYSSIEVGWHYFKLVVLIALGGAVLGCIFGVMTGQLTAETYQKYYKFPFLLFRVDPVAFVTAILVSVASASAGGFFVLRRVFALAPAEAMRPLAPADYSTSANLVNALKWLLDQPTRMIVRRLARQPLKAIGVITGLSVGMAMSVAMLGVLNGFDRAISLSFEVINRSDANVAFVEPLGEKTILEMQRLEGVSKVEPFRAVSVIFRNGVLYHRCAIEGLTEKTDLYRALTADEAMIYPRKDGIILSRALAAKLDVSPGETITAEVREGRRPTLQLPVIGVSEALLGAPAYVELQALNRALDEPGRVSGAYLRFDPDHQEDIYQALKNMPAVAGVTIKSHARSSFQKMMDEGAGSTRYIMALIAAIITFGIVYNSARIAFAEHAHDLASLRVLGFSKGEAAYVLLGELGLLVLIALPFGCLLGNGLSSMIAAGFSTDLYTVPAYVGPDSYGMAILVVLSSALIAGTLVKRDVDRLEMVSALKSRE